MASIQDKAEPTAASAGSELRRFIKAEGIALPEIAMERSKGWILWHSTKPFLLMAIPLLLSAVNLTAALFLAFPCFLLAQRSFQTTVHDLSHKLFSTKQSVNSLAGDIFAAGWIGSNVDAYSKVHIKHHRYNGSERDPEFQDYKQIIEAGGLAKYILRYVIGAEAGRLFVKYYAPAPASEQKQSSPRSQRSLSVVLRKLFPIALAQSLVLAACWALGVWYFYVIWIYLLVSWTPLLSGLRFLVEHPGSSDRTVTTPSWFLERAFFAPQSFNNHFEHHVWPMVPPYRLRAVHSALLSDGFYDRHPELLGSTFLRGLAARRKNEV